MGLFSGMYTKEGPGVPKNAPKKKGLARFFEIFGRDAGMLWRAGMLTALCFVPCILAAVFTCLSFPYLILMGIGVLVYIAGALLVGPALCGLHAVVVTTVRDEPCYMMHVYKKAWKENRRQSMPVGAVLMVLYAIEMYAGYSVLISTEGPRYILIGLVSLCFVLMTTCGLLLFLQMLFIELPIRALIKNGIMMTFGLTKRTLPAGLVVLISVALIIFLVPWPMWIMIILLGLPAFIVLVADMWAWPAMEQAFQITERQTENAAAAAAAAQAVLPQNKA